MYSTRTFFSVNGLTVLKRPLGLLLTLVLALGLAACSSRSLEPVGPAERILAFGDSLTEGIGVSSDRSYPTVLAALTGREVINAGVAGEITADGLARLPDVLDQSSPSLMVLLHGGNDILRNMDLNQTRQNLAEMIRLARSRGIQVVLVGVPEKNLFSDSAGIYPALADEFDLVIEPEIIADLIRSPSKKSDAVHFNQAGYRELAQAVFDKLDAAGAI
jgi:lysophospholipase L1-like esterase